MGSRARRRHQAQLAREKAKAARKRRKAESLAAIADDLRRSAAVSAPSAAETEKLAAWLAEAQRDQERTRSRLAALDAPRFEANGEAASTLNPSRPPRPGRLARRWQAGLAAAERATIRAEQAAAESADSEPTASVARRLSSFTWNLRITLAFALTIRRMRREGRRRQALGRKFQQQIRAAREAVREARRSRRGSARAPREAITAAGRLLAQARDEQRELVRHCERARDEVSRWEDVARHELTQGREKTAKRALARRNQWARSFSHQLREAEKQQAALAAHDGLLQAVTAEFERQTASV
jgi:hypothetical protein